MPVVIEDYEFWLLDLYNQPVRRLKAMSGRISGNIHGKIRWSGEVSLTENEISSTSWNNYRIQVKHLDLTTGREQSLGVFVPTDTKNQKDNTGIVQQVQFMDLTSILADSAIAGTLTIPANAEVITWVEKLCGEVSSFRIIADPDINVERLRSPLIFEPGTDRLKIINELLQAAGFFAIYTDPYGQLRCSKYLPPVKRPIVYQFKNNTHSKKHLPSLSWDENIFRPNEIICISTSTGDKPSMSTVARNENPASPYSFQNQHRWISRIEQNVEATSQTVLEQYAQRLLQEGSSGKVYRRETLYMPLGLNDVVQDEKEGLEVVENLSLDCIPGALLQVTSRQVGI